jgi:hypothetical protein
VAAALAGIGARMALVRMRRLYLQYLYLQLTPQSKEVKR